MTVEFQLMYAEARHGNADYCLAGAFAVKPSRRCRGSPAPAVLAGGRTAGSERHRLLPRRAWQKKGGREHLGEATINQLGGIPE
jgi:hypothetical protein